MSQEYTVVNLARMAADLLTTIQKMLFSKKETYWSLVLCALCILNGVFYTVMNYLNQRALYKVSGLLHACLKGYHPFKKDWTSTNPIFSENEDLMAHMNLLHGLWNDCLEDGMFQNLMKSKP